MAIRNPAHEEPRGIDEDLVHHVGAGGDHGAELVTVDDLGRPRAGMPGQPCDLLPATPASDMTETNLFRSSHGVRTASRICPVAASAITWCDCAHGGGVRGAAVMHEDPGWWLLFRSAPEREDMGAAAP